MKAIVINDTKHILLLQTHQLIASRYLVPQDITSDVRVETTPSLTLKWWDDENKLHSHTPKYTKGDWVLIREPWAKVKLTYEWPTATFVRKEVFYGYQYRADNIIHCPEAEKYDADDFRPAKIHVERIGGWQGAQTMPASIGRLYVLITNVSFQRLNDMTEDDAIIEGWPDDPDPDGDSPLLRYSEAWDKRLSHADFMRFSWMNNPWTCVAKFQLTTPFDE